MTKAQNYLQSHISNVEVMLRTLPIKVHTLSAKVKPTPYRLCGHLIHATASSSSFALHVVQIHASDLLTHPSTFVPFSTTTYLKTDSVEHVLYWTAVYKSDRLDFKNTTLHIFFYVVILTSWFDERRLRCQDCRSCSSLHDKLFLVQTPQICYFVNILDVTLTIMEFALFKIREQNSSIFTITGKKNYIWNV